VPESDGPLWSLGLSDAVLLRNPVDGAIVGAIDVVTGQSANVSLPPSEKAASSVRGRGPRSRSVSEDLLSSSAAAPPASAAGVAAAPVLSLNGRALKAGEFILGTVDDVVDGPAAVAAPSAKRKAKALSALAAKNHSPVLDGKQRLGRFLDSPTLVFATPSAAAVHDQSATETALKAINDEIVAELKPILVSREITNKGCACGSLDPQMLDQAYNLRELRALAEARGLPSNGAKRAIIDRLVAFSLSNAGCTGTSAASEGDEDQSEALKEFIAASGGDDLRARRAHERAQALSRACAAAESAPPAVAPPSYGCLCHASGLGCHFSTCGCDQTACRNRSLDDPSAGVYDEDSIAFHRDVLRTLNFVRSSEGGDAFFDESTIKLWRSRYARYILEQSAALSESDSDDGGPHDPSVLAKILPSYDNVATTGAGSATRDGACDFEAQTRALLAASISFGAAGQSEDEDGASADGGDPSPTKKQRKA
jgi:hypothetical protein